MMCISLAKTDAQLQTRDLQQGYPKDGRTKKAVRRSVKKQGDDTDEYILTNRNLAKMVADQKVLTMKPRETKKN